MVNNMEFAGVGSSNIGSLNIILMGREHLCDINKPNEPFEVFGRLAPVFANGEWSWSEELFETSYEKRYSDDEADYSEYIGSPDKVVFMAYIGNQCAGQIRLRRNWNKYCYIEDIAVGREYRGRGIGRRLINASVEWAKKGGMPGLMLETQDINLAACRFYHRCGFVLGAVDTRLYGNCPNKDEKALFWYMQF
jgi:streptothricin acetyltransferase